MKWGLRPVRKTRPPSEFELIAAALAPLASREPGALGLTDDAAVLDIPERSALVATTDMAIEGVHFLADDPPGDVGRKVLRFNLSDLAAMGASPLYYLLSIAVPPDRADAWMRALVEGLAEDQKQFGIVLVGGDTTSTSGPVSISITALGRAGRPGAITRGGAGVGDRIFVSGQIGDAMIGLRDLQGEISGLPPADARWFHGRYRLPTPRLELGRRLNDVATAAIDISDGLAADLGHICATSGVGATIAGDRVPLSEPGQRAIAAGKLALPDILAGGDDYELAFTAPKDARSEVAAMSKEIGLPLTDIGEIERKDGLRVVDGRGAAISLEKAGFDHFG